MAMQKSRKERDVWDEGAERWVDEERRETIEMREGENRENGENERPEGWERNREIKGKKTFKNDYLIKMKR